ncbi:hypothetical protein [Geminocystis sp. GBBB08]|uniref:hypothetical protein n=1 Tax=Geminocystis sp. GBBB08 TaxID=2604140 RepID=UPI0027E29786|nr:hypothetical protein [Geminocystis sp. GBBB08]MBL1209806.1 hypothetical protein [Geminocystis sp. GBBB08]
MTITLELSQELEQELSVEAEKINLSLSEYILHLITVREVLNNPPKTGAQLVNYWQKEGLINSRPDINDSQEYARQIRYSAEHRQHL